MTKTILSLLLSASLPLGACGSRLPVTGGTVNAAASPSYPAPVAFDNFEASYEIRTQNEVGDGVLDELRGFSAQTAAALLDGSQNACYSPASLYFALSLSVAGSRGDTRTQLLRLLGNGAADAANCAKLYRQLYTDNEIGQLKIANSLWMANQLDGKPVTFDKDFLSTASRDFYASLFTADLSAPATLSAMADWVKENTGGKITPQFEANPQALLYLMNTIYLKDEWTDRFDASQNTEDPFYLADGTTRQATFMHAMHLSGFLRGEGYTSASLALKNLGGVTFVLPDPGVRLDSLLTETRLAGLLSGGTEEQRRYGRVYWAAPKFSYASKLELSDMLKAAGVTDLFDRERADLSGMTQSEAFLSGAQQQTYIAVNEQGVEAAAYTELFYAGSGMPEEEAYMTLNRPFLYFITARNGAPLFVGVCAQPDAA